MILLLGGTADALPLCQKLLENEYAVLYSSLTESGQLELEHPKLLQRYGALNSIDFMNCLRQYGVGMVVDAAHPYAAILHQTAFAASQKMEIPYIRLERPFVSQKEEGVYVVSSHEEAAELACQIGTSIFLTTGSRHIHIYATAAQRHRKKILARVMPASDSLIACEKAGLKASQIQALMGPFSVEENLHTIQKYHCDVLISKESGQTGGLPEKIAAAKKAGAKVILIDRPENPGLCLYTTENLLHWILTMLSPI